MRTRKEILVGFIAGCVVSVPVIFLLLKSYAFNAKNVLFYIISILSIVSIILVLIYSYSDKIIESLLGRVRAEKKSIEDEISTLIDAVINNDKDIISSQLNTVGSKGLSYYLKLQFRNWIFRVILSIFVGISGLAGAIMLFNQNELIGKQTNILISQDSLIQHQNEYFRLQNELIEKELILSESNRRAEYASSTNILIKEIEEEIQINGKLDKKMINKIIFVANSLRPYRSLNDDNTIEEIPLSREKGYLLSQLVNLGIDHLTLRFLYKQIDFSHSDLKNINLEKAYLSGINLFNSRLDFAVFKEADLSGASLGKVTGTFVNFVKANMSNVDAFDAKLVNSYFNYSKIHDSKFYGSNFGNSSFDKASMVNVMMNKCQLNSVYIDDNLLDNSVLSDAEFEGAFIKDYDWKDRVCQRSNCQNKFLDSYNVSSEKYSTVFIDTSYSIPGPIPAGGTAAMVWRQVIKNEN